jgi:hypothetical protein
VSADSLRRALAAAGFPADVEARSRLAVIRAHDRDAARRIAADRARVVAAAIAHGFSHVALEIAPPRRDPGHGSDAALPGD